MLRLMQGCDFFTKDGMPRTPFPEGWKGENRLYTVGFTRRGLLGTASDAVKIAHDIADEWKAPKEMIKKLPTNSLSIILE